MRKKIPSSYFPWKRNSQKVFSKLFSRIKLFSTKQMEPTSVETDYYYGTVGGTSLYMSNNLQNVKSTETV